MSISTLCCDLKFYHCTWDSLFQKSFNSTEILNFPDVDALSSSIPANQTLFFEKQFLNYLISQLPYYEGFTILSLLCCKINFSVLLHFF